MLTLYTAFPTRSALVRFLLAELELPYQTETLDLMKGDHKAPAYTKNIHPHGLLPALVDDGQPLIECAAICLHLADKRPEKKLAPPLGSIDRGVYYQWVVYAVATELIALSKIAMHTRFLPEAMRRPEVAEEGRQAWPEIAKVVGDRVQGREWLVGTFTAADVMVGGSLWLANQVGVVADYPELVRYYDRVRARPAFQTAFGEGGPT
jgi:glutathione S-transferase